MPTGAYVNNAPLPRLCNGGYGRQRLAAMWDAIPACCACNPSGCGCQPVRPWLARKVIRCAPHVLCVHLFLTSGKQRIKAGKQQLA